MSDKLDELIDLMAQDLDYSDMVAAEQIAKISTAIVTERIRLGMNQKDFAEYLGLSIDTIIQMESGNYDYSTEELAKIFEKLNLKWNICIERNNDEA